MSLVTWGLHTTFYSTLTVTQLKLLWLMDFTADVTGYFLNKVQQGGGNKKSRKQQTDRSASVCLCLSLHNHADYINHHQLDRFHRIVSVLIRYLVCLLGTDRLTLHRRYNKLLPPPVCYFKPTQQLFGSPNSCFSSSPLLHCACVHVCVCVWVRGQSSDYWWSRFTPTSIPGLRLAVLWPLWASVKKGGVLPPPYSCLLRFVFPSLFLCWGVHVALVLQSCLKYTHSHTHSVFPHSCAFCFWESFLRVGDEVFFYLQKFWLSMFCFLHSFILTLMYLDKPFI